MTRDQEESLRARLLRLEYDADHGRDFELLEDDAMEQAYAEEHTDPDPTEGDRADMLARLRAELARWAK